MMRLLSLALAAALLCAQSPAPSPYQDPDRKLFAEVDKRNELLANLEYLSDRIGARLTGSDALKRANQWTLEKFRGYGVDSVRLESFPIAHGWTRGPATARIVEPAQHPIAIASLGWAASTPGTISGPVRYVKVEKIEDLQAYRGKLRGSIVITTQPARMVPDKPADNSLDVLDIERPPGEPELSSNERRRYRRQMQEFFEKEGVIAILREGAKEFRLLNMSSEGGTEYNLSPLPSAFIAHEDYLRLWRLLARGPVQVALDIRNETTGQVEISNTVAEIRGREKPDEYVLVGAHLDSWDLGDGSTDNGTGTSVILEAARAIRAAGLVPRRSIRFVLFAGEEQGSVGARHYLQLHKGDLDRIQAVVIHDTGTGRVKSFSVEERYDLREALDRLVEPLREAGLQELTMRQTRGSDHVVFREVGVPAFFAIQDIAGYRQNHHSQADTFDKVLPADLVQGAKVVAAFVWNLAESPDKLPRKRIIKVDSAP
jgi:hypothetical protein